MAETGADSKEALMTAWTSRALLALSMMLALSAVGLAQPRIAIKGYDPVAYFTDGRPVKGDPAISHEWDEARYLFANARNRATFAAAPDKYAPQFAGLCATGLAFGQKVEADPQAWKIVDGKLYLFSSISANAAVDKDPEILARAHSGARK
jgi:YHS domain-containing protein